MRTTTASAAALTCTALVLGACSTSDGESETDLEQEMVDEATSNGNAPEPELRDFDPTDSTTVELADGLSVELGKFERAQDASGDPAATTDITISNDTGDTFEPEGINFSVAQGPEGREADAAVMELNEHGAGSSAEFGAPIRDGDSVTVNHAFKVDADEEQIAFTVQPWDVEQAAEMTLSGDLPT